MASQLYGNNYWYSHNQACFQVERSGISVILTDAVSFITGRGFIQCDKTGYMAV